MEIRNNKNIILTIRITKDYSIQFQQKEYSVISEENIIENTLIELPTENKKSLKDVRHYVFRKPRTTLFFVL